MHVTFRYFWEAIETHERLCALSEAELSAAIHAAIDKALERTAREREQTLRRRSRQIESQRLARLLRHWLEIEKLRAPFRLQMAERETVLKFGGLELSGYIDRLDTLADGQVAIMDYKTGRTKTKDWEGDRPDMCVHPAPENVDIHIHLFGVDTTVVLPLTVKDEVAEKLHLTEAAQGEAWSVESSRKALANLTSVQAAIPRKRIVRYSREDELQWRSHGNVCILRSLP